MRCDSYNDDIGDCNIFQFFINNYRYHNQVSTWVKVNKNDFLENVYSYIYI